MNPKSRPPFNATIFSAPERSERTQTRLFETSDDGAAPQQELHAALPGGAAAALFLPAHARRPGQILPARPNLFVAAVHDREELIRDACKAAAAAGWTVEAVDALRHDLEARSLVDLLRRCTRDFTVWADIPRFHHRTLLLEGARSTADLIERMRQLLLDEGCGAPSADFTLGQLDTRCFARTVRQATSLFTVRYSAEHLLCGPPPLHRQTYLRWGDSHDAAPASIELIDLDLVCYGGDGLPYHGGHTAFEYTDSVDALLHAARRGGSRLYARRLSAAEEQLRDQDYCTAVRWLQLHSGLRYRLDLTDRRNHDDQAFERPVRFA